MVWPVTTAIALALMWGVWAVVDGISALAQAFQPEAIGKGWLVAMGILGLLAGLFAIFRPGVTAVGLTWVLGIWLVVRGLFELFGAFSSTIAQPRWLLFLSAALSIVLGLLFAFNPGTSAVAVAFWLGLMASPPGGRLHRRGVHGPPGVARPTPWHLARPARPPRLLLSSGPLPVWALPWRCGSAWGWRCAISVTATPTTSSSSAVCTSCARTWPGERAGQGSDAI